METGKTSNKVVYAGILTAITASICCITPVLALIAGTSGVASTFSWVEPFWPYLIGINIIVLVFAWYQKLRPKTQDEIDCVCEDDAKPSFWQSQSFLLIVTVFAGLMLAFPYYSNMFYAQPSKDVVYVSQSNIVKHTFTVEGMTCTGCEAHVEVESEVNKLDGILSVKASYEGANTVVEYDTTKTDLAAIRKAINGTGYKVIDSENKENE
ncbi:Copper chaperone CopZ [Flagellimonas taeanensis]|uniref:Mercuric transport protein MerT n=1 Tax=Flagellimonas taeanensis TaxID=1005926 RepID=A0A1M7B7K8_9FLAO|nr:mercuric transport protein MerTP [Allomuricauda taeanensis]SFC38147.1 Copper chaperone CopZ [Allomuricauda taeanensis]SHL50609.1 Copper chaperone CopZ [Allomuricauda taeanensis]